MSKTASMEGKTAPATLGCRIDARGCGDCPFFSADMDLRGPTNRGYCDIDINKRRRTHVRREICESLQHYCAEARGEDGS